MRRVRKTGIAVALMTVWTLFSGSAHAGALEMSDFGMVARVLDRLDVAVNGTDNVLPVVLDTSEGTFPGADVLAGYGAPFIAGIMRSIQVWNEPIPLEPYDPLRPWDVFGRTRGSKACEQNYEPRGTIIVEKQTDPDGSTQIFAFTGDASGTIGDGGQIVVGDLTPGTYTSTEGDVGRWALQSIVCSDDNSSGDTGTGTATFRVEAGETVTCVFTNKFMEVSINDRTSGAR